MEGDNEERSNGEGHVTLTGWELGFMLKHSGISSLCYSHHTLWIAHPHATGISMNKSGIVAERYKRSTESAVLPLLTPWNGNVWSSSNE